MIKYTQVIQNEAKAKRKRNIKHMGQIKINRKITDINSNISAITFNENGLNGRIKNQIDWIFKLCL